MGLLCVGLLLGSYVLCGYGVEAFALADRLSPESLLCFSARAHFESFVC